MEKWDLYTKYREKTGKEQIRGKNIPKGFYHLVVHVWIRNRKGEYLISKRSVNRPTFPLMWECVGGSDVIYECKEFNDIMDVWLFEYDGDLHLENTTTDEVADCKWMTVSEIRKLYEDKRLVQTLDYFFCVMGADEPDYSHIIGKMVSGTVDRPLGTTHPRHSEMIYPINYGYVDNVLAGDGAEQDVYIFGTNKPLKSFRGKVVAVWHRFDDVEDKWIVSLNGEDIAEEKILGDISFQEQFFYGKLYK